MSGKLDFGVWGVYVRCHTLPVIYPFMLVCDTAEGKFPMAYAPVACILHQSSRFSITVSSHSLCRSAQNTPFEGADHPRVCGT